MWRVGFLVVGTRQRMLNTPLHMLLVMLERCHQGLGNHPIEGVPKPSEGVVLRHERWAGC